MCLVGIKLAPLMGRAIFATNMHTSPFWEPSPPPPSRIGSYFRSDYIVVSTAKRCAKFALEIQRTLKELYHTKNARLVDHAGDGIWDEPAPGQTAHLVIPERIATRHKLPAV